MTAPTATKPPPRAARPLKGFRVLSLALNLPGPAALMRARQLGATCVKLEPPAGDPMRSYNPGAYAQLHEGVTLRTADLKTTAGQALLHKALARADVLITSFRPSALDKLGLQWKKLHRQYPALSQVAIVGGSGAAAEHPGHDLTYVAAHGLVTGLDVPATLYADMGGSLMASEAVLQAALHQRATGKGVRLEVALEAAAGYLALPRHWGLTRHGGLVSGAHAGYRVYPCKDGRVAVAALEPHFAAALGRAAGIEGELRVQEMLQPPAHRAIGAFLLTRTRAQLAQLAAHKDIPLHPLP